MIKKSDIQKWCDALRSGEYKQARGTLQNEDGYCCLGVACKVFIPESKLIFNSGNKFISGDLLKDQLNAPKWLLDIPDEFCYLAGKYLSTLNDYNELDFNEIADLLEAVFVYEVLND